MSSRKQWGSISDLFTNPDNTSLSAKRIGGWICLIVCMIYPFTKHPANEIFFSLCGLTTAMWSLTSVDNKVAKDAGETDGKNP